MISFGLRLTLRSGRESVIRLIITAVAVALGVGMLLTTLAGVNAVNSQNARYAWFNTGVGGSGSPLGTAVERGGITTSMASHINADDVAVFALIPAWASRGARR